jgi:hypothetical protein
VIIALFFGFKVVAILAASIYLFGFLSIKGTGDKRNRGRFSVPKFSNKIK